MLIACGSWMEDASRPLMGICLGMQLLFETSEEGDVDLLGLIPGRVIRLDPGEAGPWPHMGWNTLTHQDASDPLLKGIDKGERVYFVHGFYVPEDEQTIASTTYGPEITAITRKGSVYGCQFHPERSASTGSQILSNFLEMTS